MKKEKTNVLCYLRTHRRVWGLTVKELASLIGLRSASHLSRIEHGKRSRREIGAITETIKTLRKLDLSPNMLPYL